MADLGDGVKGPFCCIKCNSLPINGQCRRIVLLYNGRVSKISNKYGIYTQETDYSTFNIQETIRDRHMVCYKGKGKGLDTCYSAAYMSQTRDQ